MKRPLERLVTKVSVTISRRKRSLHVIPLVVAAATLGGNLLLGASSVNPPRRDTESFQHLREGGRERERERERDRETDRQTERGRQTERQRETERDTDRDRERESETDRQRQTETDR